MDDPPTMTREEIEKRAKAEYADQQASIDTEIQSSMFDLKIDAPEIGAVLTRMQYLLKAVEEYEICQEALEAWAGTLALETGANRINVCDQFILKLTLKAASLPKTKVEIVAADLKSAKAAYGK